MVAPSAGAVVTVRFPFSDLTSSIVRPALVLADSGNGDWVLCQITSNPYADASAIRLAANDFASGSLSRLSYVRPGKLFTANERLMVSLVGHLKVDSFRSVANAIVRFLQAGIP